MAKEESNVEIEVTEKKESHTQEIPDFFEKVDIKSNTFSLYVHSEKSPIIERTSLFANTKDEMGEIFGDEIPLKDKERKIVQTGFLKVEATFVSGECVIEVIKSINAYRPNLYEACSITKNLTGFDVALMVKIISPCFCEKEVTGEEEGFILISKSFFSDTEVLVVIVKKTTKKDLGSIQDAKKPNNKNAHLLKSQTIIPIVWMGQ